MRCWLHPGLRKRLEPNAGKLARPVLRGGTASNGRSLPDGQAEPSVIEGRDEVRAFYSGMFATGGQQFEVVVDKVVVSDNHVITEGQVKQVHKGASLAAMGVTEVDGEPVADDDLFVATAQLVTLWPGDDENRLIGEDIYFGSNAFSEIERITRKQLPPYYRI